MCGIAGFWRSDATSYEPGRVLSAMTDSLRHRGPDDEGSWFGDDRRLCLGHTRLSVVDLSAEGHQPMTSRSGRYVLTYNGEIFNYEDLRHDLGPKTWRGHSDTEVMLEAFEQWGVEGATKRFNGQFAYAVWDGVDGVLTLSRDRVGIKPLYYGQFQGTLIFGSELKALWQHPHFSREIDPEAVARYLELGYIPGSLSVFRGVRKLPSGHLLEIRRPDSALTPKKFWSLEGIAADRQVDGSDEHDVLDRLEGLLRDSVGRRMVADVPVGAFLSGGIDSSLVVALMQQQGSGRVRTFSVGFHEDAYDEAPHATRIAQHLGTEHTNLYVSPQEIFDLLPELPRIYDEPFADESQIPTALVSRLARQSVTVSLSGDGGDELFGGYSRYDRVARHWNRLQRIPPLVRKIAGSLAGPTAAMERTAAGRTATAAAARLVRRSIAPGQVARQLQLLRSNDQQAFYIQSTLLDARSLAGPLLRTTASQGWGDLPPANQAATLSPREAMMLADSKTYLPDDILVKVDRASMDIALEVRVPLLDHRVVELSWEIPEGLKLRDGQTKWILRELLSRHVPRSYFERPKQGFAVPIGDWLRGPLRDWGESLLDKNVLAEFGLLDPVAVRSLWRDHQEKNTNAKSMLWRILTLQSWLKETMIEPHQQSVVSASA